jgi:UDP:flavonoid glycosyltransferase YjiC (YdhE family)
VRVLVSAVPALGHVVPLLDLARALQRGGHEVRFATNKQSHGVIAGAGLRPVAAGMSTGEMVEERRRRWPKTDAQPATVWATRMWAQVMAPSTLKDLLLGMEEWSPDVVVHDEGEYAAPVAAVMANVPWITHAWGSPLRPVSDLAKLEELASGLWESCGRAMPPAAGLYAHAVVNPCPSMLQDHPLPGTSVVWPIRPRTLEEAGPALEADAYIGFGTVPSFSNARWELTAAVRACTSRGMRVVVTAPGEELRRELAEIDERLVDSREFVSLTSLLPTCKVVISHAGAGTVLASLAAGVPVILLPRGAPSQARMADACERAGVGRRCDPGGLDAALEEVIHDTGIAAAVSAAAREIAELPPAETVVAMIESLQSARTS